MSSRVVLSEGRLTDEAGGAVPSSAIGTTGHATLGSSSTGATPGTVVKKVQVFDSAGASLGYLAVYDAIT